jgi:hypothetical protein
MINEEYSIRILFRGVYDGYDNYVETTFVSVLRYQSTILLLKYLVYVAQWFCFVSLYEYYLRYLFLDINFLFIKTRRNED